MSQIDDALTALDASVDACSTRVTTDVGSLNQQIADLKAQDPTPANLAKIAAIQSKIDAMDPAIPAPAPAPAPAPTPGP